MVCFSFFTLERIISSFFMKISVFLHLIHCLSNSHLVKKYLFTHLLLPLQDSFIIRSNFNRHPPSDSHYVIQKCLCVCWHIKGNLNCYMDWDKYSVRLMLQQPKSKCPESKQLCLQPQVSLIQKSVQRLLDFRFLFTDNWHVQKSRS